MAEARADVSRLERELRLVHMRRRMLERGGRPDLAAALDVEEHGVQIRLSHARLIAADEEDALAIYKRTDVLSAVTQ